MPALPISIKPFPVAHFLERSSSALAVAEGNACALQTRLVHSESYSRVVLKIARCPGDRERVRTGGGTRRQWGRYR